MKASGNKKTIIYAVIAALVFLAVLVLTFPGRTSEKNSKRVQLVAFGDSVFGEVRDATGIPNQVAELLGMSFCNGAFGGTQAARGDREYRLDYGKDAFSLVGLSKSVYAEDFGVQQTIRLKESSTEYFEEVIDELALIDFAEVELILIQHGLNDFYAGVPIRNEKDLYDEYTFSGALRTSLKLLREKCPKAEIVLITPTYTWNFREELTCEEFDAGCGTMEDYLAAEKEVAQGFGVEVIDLYHDFFPHEQWSDWELYTRDGLHPNEAGRKMIAERICDCLQE